MSNIYIQEPPSNGKVLLTTSLGDIDVELWSKEAPKASRNFVQLCMEGYYDGTIFHRVVKGFIAQGGDPTGTGTGGASIYGKPFKDEFHQRLNFNRRGLVAMANAGANDNGSQFFFTLDRADELKKKHTIFGKVTGNTLYNMIRFNELDVDEDDRPVDPPKIIKTQVLSNPFDDIEPRKKKVVEQNEKVKEKVKSKSKAHKNYKLLSFGDEAEDDEEESEQITKDSQIKSSHDVLQDPKLSALPAINIEGKDTQIEKSETTVKKVKKKKKNEKEDGDNEDSEDEDGDKTNKKRRKIDLKNEIPSKDDHLENEEHVEKKRKEEPVNDLVELIVNERKKFRKKQKTDTILMKGDSREIQTMKMLASFQSKMSEILSTEADTDESEEEANESTDISGKDLKSGSWMTHKLKFEETAGAAKDASMKGDDWYDIYDPRNPINKRRSDASSSKKETK